MSQQQANSSSIAQVSTGFPNINELLNATPQSSNNSLPSSTTAKHETSSSDLNTSTSLRSTSSPNDGTPNVDLDQATETSTSTSTALVPYSSQATTATTTVAKPLSTAARMKAEFRTIRQEAIKLQQFQASFPNGFPRFKKLPAELRNMIWGYAMEDMPDRKLGFRGRLRIPPLMHACRDSRSLLMPLLEIELLAGGIGAPNRSHLLWWEKWAEEIKGGKKRDDYSHFQLSYVHRRVEGELL